MATKELLQNKQGEIIYPVTTSDCVVTEIVPVEGVTDLQIKKGKYYRVDDVKESLNITLPVIESNALAMAIVSFTTGTAPVVNINAESEISYFTGYSIEPNTTYELNFMFNGKKWIVSYGILE